MTRPNYTLLKKHARIGSAELGACGVAVVGVLAWPYTVDDAFIIARYARNLVAGLGYGINPYQTSDGVTGPLWLLPETLAYWLHADPIEASKLLGLCCAVLACWLALRRLRGRALGRSGAWAGAALIASSPSIGTWAVAGLETGAATLLAMLAALAATARPKPRPIALGMCAALLAWLRPELGLSCSLLLVYVALRAASAALRAALLAGLGLAAVCGFRVLMFGHLLPLSLRAKSGSIEHGLVYGLTAFVLATSLAGGYLAWLGARLGRRDDRAFAAALLAQLGAVVLAGGDWMPGYRLFVPVLPLYALVAATGSARLALRRPLIALSLIALACSVPAFDLVTRLPELRATADSRGRAAELAAFLHTHAQSVALVDIGYLGFASGAEVIDLAGLTDERIAAMPGGHLSKQIAPAYLAARAPDAIVLHSATRPELSGDGRLRSLDGFAVERRVAALRFVQAHYRVDHIQPYAPQYEYVVLLRDCGGSR